MRWLKLLLLLPLVANAQVSDEAWFVGATKYKFTGAPISLSWSPHPDNQDWENNYVFDLQVIHYERNQMVVDEKAIQALNYRFSLDRVGHYIVRLRSCMVADTTMCSDWAESWNATHILQNGVSSWWLFIWIASPTNPGVN